MRKSRFAVLAALAATGLTVTMAARAGGVQWSVGVYAPGVTTVVSNGPVGVPVVVHPAPVVHYPAPVVHYPAPVVSYPAPVVHYPAPVQAYPVPVAVTRPVIVSAPRVHVEVPPAVYAPAPRAVTYIGYPVWDDRRPVARPPVHWKHDRRDGWRHGHEYRRGDRDEWRSRDRRDGDRDDRRRHGDR